MSVPPKKVTNADSGTADVVGGDDWDALSDYFNNVDKTGPVKINTTTQYRTSKLRKRNPADTFSYIEATSAIVADRTVTEPLLIADDTKVYANHIQALTNKTLDSTNTISSATSLPTISIAKGGTGAATATLGFDALSPLTAIGDLIVGSTAGTRIRLPIGSANQALKVNSGGTTLDYGTLPVAGGGTGAVTLTGILKGNGTGAVTAITATTGALVGDTDTQNIQNKTLDSTNTISSATSLPTVTVAKGGTGAATATLGFDALSPMSAVGDLIMGSTAGTRIRLPVGTANQAVKVNSGGTAPEYGTLAVAGGGTGATTLTGFLQGNGTSPVTAVALNSVVTVLDRVVASLDINTTVTETSIYSFSVPGGTFSTNRMLRLNLICDYLNNSGTTKFFTFKVKYGGTTLYSDTMNTIAANASRTPLYIVLLLAANNATNAQVLGGYINLSDPGGATSGIGDFADDEIMAHTAIGGSATEDSTGALTFDVTITHSASDINASFRRHVGILELV